MSTRPPTLNTPNPARETTLFDVMAAGGGLEAESAGGAAPARRKPARLSLKRFDWWRLVYAVVIAALLWGYVDYKRMVPVTVDLPVRLALPEGWEELRQPGEAGERRVRVTLTGSHRVIADLREDALSISPALALAADGAAPGNADTQRLRLPLSNRDIDGLPQGITADKFDPQALDIQLTRLVNRELRVELVASGKPADGYEDNKRYKVEPASVLVRLPKNVAEKIGPDDTIKTRPFDLSGHQLVVSSRVELTPFVKDGYTVEPNPAAVYATVNLDVKPETRRLENVPLYLLLSPSPLGREFADFHFAPAAVAVTLEGPPGTLERLDSRSVRAYVDAQEATPLAGGDYGLRCRAIAPNYGRVVAIEPEMVRWMPRGRMAAPGEASPARFRGAVPPEPPPVAPPAGNPVLSLPPPTVPLG